MNIAWRRLGAWAAWAACSLGATAGTAGTAGATEHQVVIDSMAFHPKVVHVRPGDTITWLNKDLFVHNVTAAAANSTAHASSGDLAPGKSWRYAVPAAGSFDYVCTLHPVMTGHVEVEAQRRRTAGAAK
jgi:plastocyanin